MGSPQPKRVWQSGELGREHPLAMQWARGTGVYTGTRGRFQVQNIDCFFHSANQDIRVNGIQGGHSYSWQPHRHVLVGAVALSEAGRRWSPLHHDSPCQVPHPSSQIACCVAHQQELGIPSWPPAAVTPHPKASRPITLARVENAAQMQVVSPSTSCSPSPSLSGFFGCK